MTFTPFIIQLGLIFPLFVEFSHWNVLFDRTMVSGRNSKVNFLSFLCFGMSRCCFILFFYLVLHHFLLIGVHERHFHRQILALRCVNLPFCCKFMSQNAPWDNRRCSAGSRCAAVTFIFHPSVFFLAEGSISLKLLCLHIAGVIYLFDYCPASWHVPVIDGNCVPGDTGLLLSPVAYGLKDSSAERTVTLCYSSLSHFPPSFLHHFSFLVLEPLNFSRFCRGLDANGTSDLLQVQSRQKPSVSCDAWAPMQLFKDERHGHPVLSLSWSLVRYPTFILPE